VFKRNKAISSFKNEDDIKVIMLSLRNAASGTNLIEATHVILMGKLASFSPHVIFSDLSRFRSRDRIEERSTSNRIASDRSCTQTRTDKTNHYREICREEHDRTCIVSAQQRRQRRHDGCCEQRQQTSARQDSQSHFSCRCERDTAAVWKFCATARRCAEQHQCFAEQ
jgi:hypothetical protein